MTNRHFILATALVAGFAVFGSITGGPARAADDQDRADPGFVAGTGQINRGFDLGHSSNPAKRPIPAQDEARAALMSSDHTGAIDSGSSGANAAQQQAVPGVSIQTVPAKYSKRSDTLDRVPTMAWPLRLSDEQLHQIYQAVMADKSQPVADTNNIAPATLLSPDQALNGMHALPASVAGITAVKTLKYVKTQGKVWLVEPATRTVVDQISGS